MITVDQDDSRESIWGEHRSKGLDRTNLTNKMVLQAMSRVPRHKFVPESEKDSAYDDRALPIGSKQTISQPYIVALMTQEANVTLGSNVLEIGTGSGYQAAVLAEMGAKVHSIEFIPELAQQAKAVLTEMGYENVEVRQGDGFRGWKEHAPYDAILVTASAPAIPSELVKQLANRGRLVVPVENSSEKYDELIVVERDGTNLTTRNLGPVRFVPMVGAVRESLDVVSESELERGLSELEQTINGESDSAEQMSSIGTKKSN